MAEKIELLVSAKNAADAALKDARADVRNLEKQVRQATDALEATGQGRRDVEKLIDTLGQARVEAKRWALVQKDAAAEVEKAGNSARSAGRKFDSVSRSQSKSARGGSAFAAGWGKVTAVAAGVTAAIAGLSGAFNFLSSSITEAREARKAAAQTAAVLRSMGRTEAPAGIDKMLDQLSRMSGIDDDELRQMTNVMLTFGQVTGSTFTKANRLALDLSVAFGKDLQSSAVMVGKALNDPAKGLTALSRIGVSFTKQQQDQVKAMTAAGDVAGAQKIILRELEKQVGGSAKAQADGIGKMSTAWGNLKESIGDALMDSFSNNGGLVDALNDATKWIKKHKLEIVSVLQAIMSAVYKLISIWLKYESIVLKVLGYTLGAAATTLGVLAKMGLVSDDAAQGARDLAEGFGKASEQADAASKYFDDLSTSTADASKKTKQLADALKSVKGRKVKLVVGTVVTGIQNLGIGAPVDQPDTKHKGRKKHGDTAVPRGAGSAGGLAAAHRITDAGIPGRRTITSAWRDHHLGSPRSDHVMGRALDLSGPGLNAYAARVRAAGGFAAFHGSGPDRHLHAVPGGGTVTEVHHHYRATVNNPSSNVDVRAVYRQMQAEAAADARRRGPGWPGNG